MHHKKRDNNREMVHAALVYFFYLKFDKGFFDFNPLDLGIGKYTTLQGLE